MISQVLTHPQFPAGLAMTFGVGVALILGGALGGHTAAAISGTLTPGIVLVCASLFALVLKIDHYLRTQRREKNNADDPDYVPSDRIRAYNAKIDGIRVEYEGNAFVQISDNLRGYYGRRDQFTGL